MPSGDGFVKILETLSGHPDGLTLSELCARTNLSKKTVLRHLRTLVNINLVKIERQGNQTIYKSCMQDPRSVSEGLFAAELCGMYLREYIKPLDISSCSDFLVSCFTIMKLEMEVTNAYCLLDPGNAELCLPESLKIAANYTLGFLSDVSTSIRGNRQTFLKFYRKRLHNILTRHHRRYVRLETITENRTKVGSIKAAYSDFRRPKNPYPYSRKELRVICELLLRKRMTWTQLRTHAGLSSSGLKNILDKLLDKAIRKEIRVEENIAKLYTIDFHGLMEDLLERFREKLRRMLRYGKVHPEAILKQPLYPLLLSFISLHLRILHEPKTIDDSVALFMNIVIGIHDVFLEVLRTSRQTHITRAKQYIKTIYEDLIMD